MRRFENLWVLKQNILSTQDSRPSQHYQQSLSASQESAMKTKAPLRASFRFGAIFLIYNWYKKQTPYHRNI
ncbi:uncharacterized protein METZ01_LOCUS120510 [marine metagenome]|uniref:Uncharacterized protein n=1 Tax=marine metagenome TaxID=408172 RepID=A0A381XS74_9ZZZZ